MLCFRFSRYVALNRHASDHGKSLKQENPWPSRNNEGITLSLAPSRVSRWDKPPCRCLLPFAKEGITFQLLPARFHGHLHHLSTHVTIPAAAASIHKRHQCNSNAELSTITQGHAARVIHKSENEPSQLIHRTQPLACSLPFYLGPLQHVTPVWSCMLASFSLKDYGKCPKRNSTPSTLKGSGKGKAVKGSSKSSA